MTFSKRETITDFSFLKAAPVKTLALPAAAVASLFSHLKTPLKSAATLHVSALRRGGVKHKDSQTAHGDVETLQHLLPIGSE